MRLAAVLALLALTGCGGGSGEQGGAPSPSARPRVESALCDDLRTVVSGRAAGRETGVADAAGRVLVQLGSASGAPEDVVDALRAVEGGGPPDDAVDATLSSWTAQECGP